MVCYLRKAVAAIASRKHMYFVIAMVLTNPKPNHWKSKLNGENFVQISNAFGQNGSLFCLKQNTIGKPNRELLLDSKSIQHSSHNCNGLSVKKSNKV